jgi:hypothetical protein
VLTLASDEGLIDAGLKIRTMRLPDRFQDQDKPEKQYDEAGLNAPHIVDTVLKALRMIDRPEIEGLIIHFWRSMRGSDPFPAFSPLAPDLATVAELGRHLDLYGRLDDGRSAA